MTEEKIRKRINEEIKKFFELKKNKIKPTAGTKKIQYSGAVYDENEIISIVNTLLDGWFGIGKNAEKFELKFSNFLNSKYTIITNSGSSANLLSITALTQHQLNNRLKYGDEVITPAVTFPTTFNPIIQNNLKPVLIDVDLGTYNINPEKIKEAISDKTRLIMIPHTLGNPNEMDTVIEIADDHDLFVIEDSCDALGSKYKGKMCGTFGDIGTFSFYPAHHMTMGEGAIVTDDPELRTIIKSLRDWGRACFCRWNETNLNGACGKRFDFDIDGIQYDHKYIYTNIGYNLKPLDLQAAMGIEQLNKLPKFIGKRKDNFKVFYDEFLNYDDYFILPKSIKGAEPSWFSFPLTIRNKVSFKRSEILNWLEKSNIQTRLIFAGNIIRQPAYKEVKYRVVNKLENSDKIMKDSFFIGLYPGITEEEIKYILLKFREFIKKHSR
jgi:CDP-6-deoxy-D-xylo-4-hexulose-3-dehydrase